MSISEAGMYFYITTGDSDLDTYPIKKGESAAADFACEQLMAAERKLAEAEKVLNNGLMEYKGEKPCSVKICNTFQPDSAGGEDVPLCVDVTKRVRGD